MSLQVFNSYGLWLGGWTQSLPKEEYFSVLESKLRDAIRIYYRMTTRVPKKVVLHKEGEILPKESELIINMFDKKCKIVSIKKLGIPRIYNLARRDHMVKRGTFVQIDEDTAVLATSGPPHPIKGSQQPLIVEIKYPDSNKEIILRETCLEVFYLSLVSGGYTLAITSKPITTHFADLAVRQLAKYELEESPLLWRKAWFI